ncbi:MAG: hypothetical protein QG589_415 [Patescibacteria group bacterium]|nr:hypothetical protein [Patescibacteria group bacterium]
MLKFFKNTLPYWLLGTFILVILFTTGCQGRLAEMRDLRNLTPAEESVRNSIWNSPRGSIIQFNEGNKITLVLASHFSPEKTRRRFCLEGEDDCQVYAPMEEGLLRMVKGVKKIILPTDAEYADYALLYLNQR